MSTATEVSEIKFQVLGSLDIDEIYNFALQQLREQNLGEVATTFKSWQAKWRREALEHYLKLGWSFIARRDGAVVGFFLAQPFLFFRGQTQSLWVEWIESSGAEVTEALIDVAVKVAREKHLQRVLFAEAKELEKVTGQALKQRRAVPLEDDIVVVQTTKG